MQNWFGGQRQSGLKTFEVFFPKFEIYLFIKVCKIDIYVCTSQINLFLNVGIRQVATFLLSNLNPTGLSTLMGKGSLGPHGAHWGNGVRFEVHRYVDEARSYFPDVQ